MTNAQHMPAPLHKSVDSQAMMLITLRGGEVVAKLSNEYITTSERNAYARLFTAAPELLDALKGLLAECDRLGNALSAKGQGATVLGMCSTKARASIAKAEGDL